MSLHHHIREYGIYLNTQSERYSCTPLHSIEMGYSLPFDRWREREFPEYFAKKYEAEHDRLMQKALIFYSQPVEQRIKAIAMIDLLAIMREYGRRLVQNEEELEAAMRALEGEEIGEGMFS